MQQQQNNEHFDSAELERFGRALLDCPSSGLSKQLVDPVLHKLCDLIDLELHPEFLPIQMQQLQLMARPFPLRLPLNVRKMLSVAGFSLRDCIRLFVISSS